MEMRTICFSGIFLAPPGPVQRDLSRLATRCFREWGAPSSLALPNFLPLAVGLPLGPLPGELELARLWEAARGEFSKGDCHFFGKGLYLELLGPVAELAALAGGYFQPIDDLPFVADRGFFLGLMAFEQGANIASATSSMIEFFSFRSARLVLMSMEAQIPELRYLRWKEKCSSYRKDFKL